MRLEGMVSKTKTALELLNDGIWRKNALIFHAVGLFPLVAFGVTLKNAVMLSAVTAFVLIVTSLAVSLIGKGLPGTLRWALCALVSAAAQIPAIILADMFSNATFSALEFTLMLLCVNTLLYFRRDMVEINKGIFTALITSLAHSIGFALVLCVVSSIREILAFGTVWGVALPFGGAFPSAALPFAGFFVIAFFTAAFKGVLGLVKREGKGDVK